MSLGRGSVLGMALELLAALNGDGSVVGKGDQLPVDDLIEIVARRDIANDLDFRHGLMTPVDLTFLTVYEDGNKIISVVTP